MNKEFIIRDDQLYYVTGNEEICFGPIKTRFTFLKALVHLTEANETDTVKLINSFGSYGEVSWGDAIFITRRFNQIIEIDEQLAVLQSQTEIDNDD